MINHFPFRFIVKSVFLKLVCIIFSFALRDVVIISQERIEAGIFIDRLLVCLLFYLIRLTFFYSFIYFLSTLLKNCRIFNAAFERYK